MNAPRRGIGGPTAGALLWIVAASIGVAVAQGWTARFDAAVLLAIAGPLRAAGWPVAVALAATAIGAAPIRLALAALAAIGLVWRRDLRGAVVIVAAAAGALLGNVALKMLVGRTRPELLPHLAVETSLSFPSGHSANAAAVYAAIGWALVRCGVPGRWVWPGIVLLIAAVGVSRVVLGVHWPTDVIAGWCVGAGWMLLCAGVAGRDVPHARPDAGIVTPAAHRD